MHAGLVRWNFDLITRERPPVNRDALLGERESPEALAAERAAYDAQMAAWHENYARHLPPFAARQVRDLKAFYWWLRSDPIHSSYFLANLMEQSGRSAEPDGTICRK